MRVNRKRQPHITHKQVPAFTFLKNPSIAKLLMRHFAKSSQGSCSKIGRKLNQTTKVFRVGLMLFVELMMMAVKDVCTLGRRRIAIIPSKLFFVLKNAIAGIFFEKLKIDWQIAVIVAKLEHETSVQFSARFDVATRQRWWWRWCNELYLASHDLFPATFHPQAHRVVWLLQERNDDDACTESTNRPTASENDSNRYQEQL